MLGFAQGPIRLDSAYERDQCLPKQHCSTQAAEGLPRLRWSLAEFDRLTELGMFEENDRIELIGGELDPMQANGARHEFVKTKLVNRFMRRLPDDLELAVELGWRPGGTCISSQTS